MRNRIVCALAVSAIAFSLVLGCGGGSSSSRPPDREPPTVVIETPTAATTHTVAAGPITLGGTATDNVGVDTVTWRNADTGDTGPATGTDSWSAAIPLASGPNLVTVTASDARGNEATDSILVTVTTGGGGDTTPPTIAIDTPTAGPAYLTSITPIVIGGTAADDVGVATVTWANAATSGSGTATGTMTWSASISLAAGSNAITLTAEDAAGNSGTDIITVTLDATPPTVSIETPTTGQTYTTASSPVSIGGTALDSNGVAAVTWSNAATGGGGTASGTDNWLASVVLAAGTNGITVTAEDTAGNTATDTITVTLDATPPTVTIEGPTSAPICTIDSSPVALDGTAQDDTLLAAVDWFNAGTTSSGTATGTSSWSASIPLTPGANPITMTAWDDAGNSGTDSILVMFDAAPPAITITTPSSADSYWASCTPLYLAGVASDDAALATVTWQNLDTGGGGLATGTYTWSADIPLAMGSNQIVVTAVDGVGRSSTDTIDVTLFQGTMEAWGSNGNGELGNGSFGSFAMVPGTVLNMTEVVDFDAGEQHSVVAHCDGTAWAWGLNNAGQLGDGTTVPANTPLQVVDPTDPVGFLQGVTSVAAGAVHTLAIIGDGTVRAWGNNDFGQLGDGTQTQSSIPVVVIDPSSASGVLENVIAVDCDSQVAAQAGDAGFSLALIGDGTVRGWGRNNYGKLGDGTTGTRTVPVQAVDPSDPSGYLQEVAAISVGYGHSVALMRDGTVKTWGCNDQGQLGDPGAPNPSLAPVQVVDPTDPSGFLTGVVSIGAAKGFTLAILDDGTVRAWGHNAYGQLGDNSQTDRSSPVQVLDPTDPTGVLQDVIQVSAGGSWIPYFHGYSLALLRDGTVRAWGSNGMGQLGDNSQTDRLTPVQVEDPRDPTGFLTGVTGVSAGDRHSIARR